MATLFSQPYSDGVHVLDDLLTRWSQGQQSGALVGASERTVQSGGVAMRAGFLHPSSRPARNEFLVSLPAVNPGDLLVLITWAGVDDNARRDDPQNPHDGVRARILVENQVVAEAECDTAGWRALSADLTPYAGKTVKVVFEMDPKGNSAYDWAYFGLPQVVRLRERFALKVSRNLPPEGVLEVRGAAGDRFTLDAPNYPPLRAEIPPSGVLWLHYAFAGARGATLSETQPQTTARIYPLQPRLRLESVATRRAVLSQGEITEVVARVRNIGAGTWQNDRMMLSVQSLNDVEILSRPEPTAELLPPNGVYETRFRVRVGARPRLSVMLRSSAGNDATVIAPVVAANAPNLPSSGVLARAENGFGVLQNESLRVVITPASSGGHAARVFVKQGGEWVPVASSAPIAEAVVNAEGAPPKRNAFTVESITADAAAMRLILQGRVGLTARASLEYRLEGEQLRCVGRLTADVNAHLYRFRFPDWRVGDGSFGEAKDEALFPGLEYLIGEERSSSTTNAAPPFDLRFAPDPYKITAPVMAVRWRNLLVSLEWDPTLGWSGVLRAPNALFASPNFLESGANHRLALWVPSIPRWADENSEQAREPFRLLRGDSVLLQATLSVRTDASDVIQAIARYLERVGAPVPPAPQRNDFGALQLTVQGLLNSYDASKRAWLHTNTGPVEYDPIVAQGLWVLGHRLFPEDPRRRQAVEQVRAAVDALPAAQQGIDIAFYVGGLPSVLEAYQKQLEAEIGTQREDGSWAWQPSTPRHAIFGKAGDSSSGWTGMHAERVGRYARMTLQPAARESLLRSLRYLNRQRRPEGAQTWELPLHVPDLLASAHAINAFMDAYTITGDSEYLRQAELWALRGTPFIYLWHTPDKPIMRGASIPVFGVTWLGQQPWFGVAVQWNGLAYARALYRLHSRLDIPVQAETTRGLDIPVQAETARGLDIPVQAETTRGLDIPVQAETARGLDIPVQAETARGLDIPVQAETARGLDIPVQAETTRGLDIPVQAQGTDRNVRATARGLDTPVQAQGTDKNVRATVDWKRLADAITLCAVQQQEWVSDRRANREGFYPDAFNIPRNVEEYTWDLNPRLIAPCIAQRLGFAIEPMTQVVRDGGRLIACTAPGLQEARMENGALQVRLIAPASDLPAVYALIAGVRTPRSVTLNGAPLSQVDDMDALIWQIPNPQSGWAMHPLGLIVRIVNPAEAILMVEE